MTKPPPNTRRARSRAERLRDDPDAARRTAEKALRKAQKNRGRLSEVWEELTALLRLVEAWATGAYREIPAKSVTLALLGVVYFLSPIDAIPDFLPVIGFGDDAAVLYWVIGSIRDDIDAFRRWESARTARED